MHQTSHPLEPDRPSICSLQLLCIQFQSEHKTGKTHRLRHGQREESGGQSLKRYRACGACRCMEMREGRPARNCCRGRDESRPASETRSPSSPFNLHSCAIDHESGLSKREIDALQKWRRPHSQEGAPSPTIIFPVVTPGQLAAPTPPLSHQRK